MGVCGGVARCTPEQQEELFCIAAREMLLLCAEKAVSEPSAVSISAPSDVANVRATVLSLGSCAEMAGSLVAMSGVANGSAVPQPASPPQQAQSTGIISGMLKKAADLAQEAERSFGGANAKKASLQAQAGVSIGAEESLEKKTETGIRRIAEELESSVNIVEESLFGAGLRILDPKKEEVLGAFAALIDQINVDYLRNPPSMGAIKLIRGEMPCGQEQYQACLGDRVSTYFMKQSTAALEKSLRPILEDVINSDIIKQRWDVMLSKWGVANAKLGEFEFSKGFQQGELQVDLIQHIVKEIVSQLGILMGKAEPTFRSNPLGKSRRPGTFALCFSGDPPLNKRLPAAHYFNRTM